MIHDACQARLLDAALDGAHPDYFAGLSRGLLNRARQSPIGRRMLLRQLLSRTQPLLTHLFALSEDAIAEHPWVLWDAADLHEAAADLGAIALIPGLRAFVDRASVLRLRAAIGSGRLAMALTFQRDERIPDAVNVMARRALAEVIRDADAIAALVARNGYRELAGHAERIHPAFSERVRLAFRPEWRSDPQGTWLSSAVVARYFEQRERHGTEQVAVAPDDENPNARTQAGEIAA